MRRIVVALLGVALLVPAPWATAEKPPRYKGYLVCSAKKTAEPASECKKNKPKTAVFLSKDQDVVYKVCVKFPDDKKLCASHQPAEEGVKDAVTVTATTPGRIKATWYVDDEKVASWTMEIDD